MFLLNNTHKVKILNTLHLLSYTVAGEALSSLIGRINDRALHETLASTNTIGCKADGVQARF